MSDAKQDSLLEPAVIERLRQTLAERLDERATHPKLSKYFDYDIHSGEQIRAGGKIKKHSLADTLLVCVMFDNKLPYSYLAELRSLFFE